MINFVWVSGTKLTKWVEVEWVFQYLGSVFEWRYDNFRIGLERELYKTGIFGKVMYLAS